MSGLCAVVRPRGAADLSSLGAMLRAMDARGPDARREERLGDAGAIGVTALGEAGPAWDTERRWCVAVDGEWTNLAALRKELSARDLDVGEGSAAIAAAVLAEIGFERAIQRLRGDVALVAWEARERRLWAVRDRTGTRPLHVATLADGTVLVASEARALLRHPGVDGTLDADAIRRLLVLGFCAAPGTPWRGVRKVGSGCLARVDAAGLVDERYWDEGCNPSGAGGARNRWARSCGYGVELAVGLRAQGDVALATSGGAYATAIAGATAARRRTAPPGLFAAFDGGVPEGARAVAVTGDDALLDEIAAGMDEPPVDPEAVGWWALARAAGDAGCVALLHGAGGAELFGGPAAYFAQRVAGLPGGGVLGKALGARAGGWARRAVRWRGEVGAGEDREELWADVDALAAACPGDDPVGRAFWLDRHLRLAEGTLATIDRACAAHGLSPRAPFADPDLVALVAQVPTGHLVQVRRPRGLFEEALAERLGEAPPKHAPMAVPISAWLAGAALDDLAEGVEGLADPDAVRRFVADFRAGRADVAPRLWALRMLARWRRLRA